MPQVPVKTIAIAAVVVAVVVAAAYFLVYGGAYGAPEGEEAAEAETPAPAAQPAEAEGEVIEVKLYEWKIEPSEIRVKAGSTVTFVIKNTGSYPHALTIERADIGFRVDSETIGGGGETRLTVTFEEPGEYVIYCPVGNHRAFGMEGVLIVEP
jgi:plastocyanin